MLTMIDPISLLRMICPGRLRVYQSGILTVTNRHDCCDTNFCYTYSLSCKFQPHTSCLLMQVVLLSPKQQHTTRTHSYVPTAIHIPCMSAPSTKHALPVTPRSGACAGAT